jgi:hypothetical protein
MCVENKWDGFWEGFVATNGNVNSYVCGKQVGWILGRLCGN